MKMTPIPPHSIGRLTERHRPLSGGLYRFLTACVATVLLVGTSAIVQAQPVALDERGLAVITASGAFSHDLDAHPVDDKTTASRSGSPASGVVIGSQYHEQEESVVHLDEQTQADARAANLVNAAGSDIAQGINVLDLLMPEMAGLNTRQSNRITQNSSRNTRLGFFTQAPDAERLSHTAINHYSTSTELHQLKSTDQYIRNHTKSTSLNAAVEPVRVGFFDDPVSLGAPSVDLPAFTVQLPNVVASFSRAVGEAVDWFSSQLGFELGEGETFTKTLSFNPVSVSNARLDFGEITAHGNDVILTGPSLWLPDLSFNLCISDSTCGDGGASLSSVIIPGGWFKLGDIHLDGVNPLGDLGIDLAYAIAGDGSITVDAGSLSFTGEIPLDVGLVNNLFDLNVDGYGLVREFSADLDIPDFDIPVDVNLDLPVPDDFNRTLTGETCVFSSAQRGCIPLNVTTKKSELRNQSTSDSHYEQTQQTNSRVVVGGTRTRGAVELRSGEGDLLVFRNALAQEDRYIVVVMEGEAQTGFSALNAINAAGTLVSNGLNVIAASTPGQSLSAADRSQTFQSNVFTQIGGLR